MLLSAVRGIILMLLGLASLPRPPHHTRQRQLHQRLRLLTRALPQSQVLLQALTRFGLGPALMYCLLCAAEKPRELTEKEKMAAALFGGISSTSTSSSAGRGRRTAVSTGSTWH